MAEGGGNNRQGLPARRNEDHPCTIRESFRKVPTLRGCRSYGHTLDKAMDNITEAAVLCLEDEKSVSGAAFVGLRDLEIVA